MLISARGHYEERKIILDEEVFFPEKTAVIVIFLDEQEQDKGKIPIPGALSGKVNKPDDFNNPLDDLKNYM